MTTTCSVLVLGAVVLGASAVPSAAQTRPARPYEVRGFAVAGSEATESPQTFDAILGDERITLAGAGGEIVILRRWIVRGQWSRFSGTGTRVFVDNDETVFDLGIPLDVRVTVTEFSAGYHLISKPRWGLYAAAGRSTYSLREESNGESARSDGSGWHVLGGGEIRPHKWIFVAGEGQWTKTEDILTGGAAEALGESRLGGIRVGGRVGFRF